MPGIDFGEVRARIALADVLDLLGFVPSKASGDQVRGPCPVHRSDSTLSRSFSANLKLHIYRCFKCGSYGNQLDLYAAATGLGLFAATVALCEQLHQDIPWIAPGKSEQLRTANPVAQDQPTSHDAGVRRTRELA
jgi:DNA primase